MTTFQPCLRLLVPPLMALAAATNLGTALAAGADGSLLMLPPAPVPPAPNVAATVDDTKRFPSGGGLIAIPPAPRADFGKAASPTSPPGKLSAASATSGKDVAGDAKPTSSIGLLGSKTVPPATPPASGPTGLPRRPEIALPAHAPKQVDRLPIMPVDGGTAAANTLSPPKNLPLAALLDSAPLPGEATQLLAVGRGVLNRLVTPFDRPKPIALKDATLTTRVVGRSVYVAINGTDPAGLFIGDGDDETGMRAIAVQLLPQDIPARSIALATAGAAETVPNTARARRWEETQPYVDTLTELLRTLANGELPAGYALVEPPGTALRCAPPGLRTRIGQWVRGNRFEVAVHVAENISDQPLQVAELACALPGAVAAAAWPRAALEPGESTELYVVVRADRAGVTRAARPRLLATE